MRKKILVQILVLVIALMGAGMAALIMNREKEPDSAETETETEHAQAESAEEYVPAEPYRDSKANQKILPERVEISDADGNVYMTEEYNPEIRSMQIGKFGEIGLYPEKVYLHDKEGTVLLEQHEYGYDEDGMVISDQCYIDPNPYDGTEEWELEKESVFTYYDGLLAKEEYYSHDNTGVKTLANSIVWTYDDNGFAVRRDIYTGTVLSYYEDITCNSNGSPVEIRQYTYNDVLTGVKEYTYSETGEFLIYKEYSGDKETLNLEREFHYDSKDYLREIVETYSDGPYEYVEGEENEPVYTQEFYTLIYPDDMQSKLGTWNRDTISEE